MKFLAVLVIAGALLNGRAAVLDTNFSITPFATVPSQLTGLAWAPDGSNRLFVTHKGGSVRIVKDGVLLPGPFATISPIYTQSECGLIGLCFDPNFAANGYVYFFVTVSSTQQQIIRYKAVGDIGTEKTTIVSNLPTIGQNHDGGGIEVGPDGKLYWAIGDLGNASGVDGNLTSLAAKVGRANLDGSLPSDNPFADAAGPNNDFIWARGFRNPFTLTFQPTTGELWVNCVGTAYEQIFVVRATDHAGWNDYENNQPPGYITPKIKYRTNGTDVRTLAPGSGAVRTNQVATFTTTTAHRFRQGERITITGVADTSFNGAVYVLATPSPQTFTASQDGVDAASGGGSVETQPQGGCVTGGAFFDSTAVPLDYRQNFFYGDLNSGRIMRAIVEGTNVTQVDYFITGSPAQLDIALGPDGAMYYGNHGGTISRFAYTNITEQAIVTTPTVLRMMENGLSTAAIRLAQEPAAEVTLTVSAAENSGIEILDGTTLTFSPTNWSIPQYVRIRAATDDNSDPDTTTLSISGNGLESAPITVHVIDVGGPQPVEPPTLMIASEPGVFPIELSLAGTLGETYVIEAVEDLMNPWVGITTNRLETSITNVLDEISTEFPIRFYRARQETP